MSWQTLKSQNKMAEPYLIPSITQRTQTEVAKSRFITTVGPTPTVEDAKALLSAVRAEMPDATHHVYAYRVGFASSVIESMSDDGEPSGTSGPPVLAVVRGSGIGDITVVVTRYFGGTKLGTGGLVRAYTEAAQTAIKALPTELKIAKALVGVELSYHQYTPIKRLLPSYEAEIESEDFGAAVMLMLKMPTANYERFCAAIIEETAGSVIPILLDG